MSQVFAFQSQQIRTAILDNQPWFVAKDVAAALGLHWTGHVLSSVPDIWQRVVKLTTLRRGSQGVRVISEPAVYKLAFRSNKPEADAFTNWVASEVLPAIRKTGRYEAVPQQPALPAAPSLPDATPEYRRMREDIDLVVSVLNGTICSMQVYGAQSGLFSQMAILQQIRNCASASLESLYAARDRLKDANRYTLMLSR